MPDNRIDELFGQLAGLTLPVPDPGGVVGRGRQRRRQFRYLAAAAGLAAIVVVAGSATVITHALAGNGGTIAPPAGPHRTRHEGQRLPAGTGRLLLGVTNSGTFELGRSGSQALEPLRDLRPLVIWHSLIATNPSGGWVVTYAAGPAPGDTSQPERLATVSTTGQVHAFGPVFSVAELTGIAVRPDGSAVAVAVSATPVSTDGCRCKAAEIMLLPLPGHTVRGRTWILASATRTMAEDLSWAPDGIRLTYVAGANEYGGGFTGHGAVTLDTAQAGTSAPAITAWPPFRKGRWCNMIGGSWAGRQYLALEACGGQGEHMELVPASVTEGAKLGSPVTVQGWGCAPPILSVASGSQVLVSYCGVQTRNGGAYGYLLGSLAQAAWAGP
jgi:hypothetical protein